MPKVPVTCSNCGQVFYVWPYRLKQRSRFCSRRCKTTASQGIPATNRSQLSGCRFGLLEVVKLVGTANGHTLWQCRCSCGNTTTVRAGELKRGAVKSCGCLNHRRGQNHPNWRRGYTINSDGYRHVLLDDDSREKCYEAEHRLVAAEMLGRPLASSEIVHHINRIKTDNRPENLVVLSREEHAALHAAEDQGVA